MMITPTAVMTKEEPEKMRERAKANGYANGTKYGSLESQVMYDPKFSGLLKTPSAMDAASENMQSKGISGTSGTLAQEMMSGYAQRRGFPARLLPTPLAVDIEHRERTENLKATGVKDFHSRINGASRPNGLMDYLRFTGMLPTLRTCSAMGASLDTDGNLEGNRCPNLETVVGRMLLPAPRANKVTDMDLNNPALAERNKANLEEEVAKMVINDMLPTPTCNDAPNATLPKSQEKRNDSLVKRILTGEMGISIPKEDGQTFRLSPLFTEEMMGFPFLWTTLPFLRHNGEPNPSKPTETQSCRK